MAARNGKRKAGRPKKLIVVSPESVVTLLCSRMCPTDDIALELGIARSTFYERFPDAIKKGHAAARNEMRGLQLDILRGGNAVMGIWLGKQYLGQTDKLPDFTRLSDEELCRLAAGAEAGAAGVGETSDGASGDPASDGSGIN